MVVRAGSVHRDAQSSRPLGCFKTHRPNTLVLIQSNVTSALLRVETCFTRYTLRQSRLPALEEKSPSCFRRVEGLCPESDINGWMDG